MSFIRSTRFGGLLFLAALICMVVACDGAPSGNSPYDIDSTRSLLSHQAFHPVPLAGRRVNSSLILGQPGGLARTGKFLWILDYAQDPFLHVVDLESGDIVRSFGRRGEGPGEFGTMTSINAPDPNGQIVWAFDGRLQRFTRLSLDANLETQPFQAAVQRPAPLLVRALFIQGGRVVGLSSTDSSRFLILDTAGNLLARHKGPLLGPDSIRTEERLRLSHGVSLCEMGVDHGFAVAYFAAGRIERHDAGADLVNLFSVPFSSNGLFIRDKVTSALTASRGRYYYRDCKSTRRFVFALFSGRWEQAFPPNTSQWSNFVHVFDQSGNLKVVLQLDHTAFGIAVGEGDSTLYTASIEDAAIYQYHLPASVRQ